MGERHIKEDFISCDWCNKEVKGFRCSKETDMERMLLGNVVGDTVHMDSGFSSFSSGSYSRQQILFTGLEIGDLCAECRKKLYDHIKSFITTAKYVEKKVIDGD